MRKAGWVAVIVVVVLGAIVLALFIASSVASSRFRARYGAEKEELLRRGRAAPTRVVDPARVSALPAPVKRYLEVMGTAGKPAPKVAVLAQRGTLRTGRDKPWMPFESEQAYSMQPPGFVWLARAQVAPLFHMMARDKLVEDKGNMLIRILGVFTVADASGPELDQGAGLRYWGEILSFPEMAVAPQVRWEPIDDRRARFIVESGGLKLTAIEEFAPDGLPVATHAERYRDVGGRSVLTPWTGTFRDWKRIGGRLFPTRWQSVWHLPEGDFEAVNIEILDLDVE